MEAEQGGQVQLGRDAGGSETGVASDAMKAHARQLIVFRGSDLICEE
jgi:hypothetical protein